MATSRPPGVTKPPTSSADSNAQGAGRRLLEAGVNATLTLTAMLVALTCAGGRAGAPPTAAARSAEVPVDARSAPTPTPASSANDSLAVTPAPVSSTATAATGVPRFFAALGALQRGERRESVRAVWYGDSHTAADYWSGTLRASLAARFGSGGPGFVRLGVPYRHDLAVLNRTARLHIEPEPPSRRTPQDDGVFGLGGMRVFAEHEPVRMTLKLPAKALRGHARYRLLFDLPEHASFVVGLGQRTQLISERTQARTLPGSPILRLDLEGESDELFSVETRAGRPHFYGVLVEGSEPGVVLDTLGIDGARIATALAWSEPAFVSEVAARAPELFVIAYGTNEAFDGLDVQAYDHELTSLVTRLRRAAPLADCLVLGPPDALLPTGESAPRVATISAVYQRVAERQACTFVSMQALMGGPGSFVEWQRLDLARNDRIHFTPKGYRRLGELLVGAVFGADFVPAPAAP